MKTCNKRCSFAQKNVLCTSQKRNEMAVSVDDDEDIEVGEDIVIDKSNYGVDKSKIHYFEKI